MYIKLNLVKAFKIRANTCRRQHKCEGFKMRVIIKFQQKFMSTLNFIFCLIFDPTAPFQLAASLQQHSHVHVI